MSLLSGFHSSRKYKLFISHDWEYTDEYDGVLSLLNAAGTFHWENLSVPIDKPIPSHPTLPKSHWTILRKLKERIERADCLLVLAGMYINFSGWIQSEIELAQEFHKPIIAVKRWGQERVPEALQRVFYL